MQHPFILAKGTWLGQGTLLYTLAKETLTFLTKWEIYELSPGIFQAKHRVEISGADECHVNVYTFFPINNEKFRIIIQNPIIDMAEGHGFINENCVGWNIDSPSMKGYETFTKLDENTYTLQGEYFSQEITSKIEGKIWKKQP